MIKTDFIISIGPACRPAEYLRQHNLRHFSCPLDWQMGYSLPTVIHLFQTSFSDFFECIEQDKINPIHNDRQRRVRDTKNDIISIHHFDANKSLAEEHVRFRYLMQERYIRMHNEITNSETISLICNRTDSLEKLSQFLQQFGDIYPNQNIVLINIRSNDLDNDNIQENFIDINDHLRIVEYEFHDVNKDGSDLNLNPKAWLGNECAWNQVMQNIKISTSYLMKELVELNYTEKKIIVYGAGRYCIKLIQWLNRNNVDISGIAVSDKKNNPQEIQNIPVRSISEYSNKSDESIVLVSVNEERKLNEIKSLLNQYHFNNVISPYI